MGAVSRGLHPLAKRNRLPPAVAHLCSHRYIGYIPEHTSTRLIFSRVRLSRKYIILSALSRNIAVLNSDIPSKFKTLECSPTSLCRRSPYRSTNSRRTVLRLCSNHENIPFKVDQVGIIDNVIQQIHENKSRKHSITKVVI